MVVIALPHLRALMNTTDHDAAPRAQGAKAAAQDAGRGDSSSIQQPEHPGKHAPEEARKSTEERTSRAAAKIE